MSTCKSKVIRMNANRNTSHNHLFSILLEWCSPVCKPPMLLRAQLRSQPEHPSKSHDGDDYSGNDKPVVSESGWTVSIGHPVKHNHGDVSDDVCIGIGKVDKFQIFLSNPLWQRCHIFSGQHYSICSGCFANIAIF